MLDWTKDKTGGYRAYTGAGTYTIKRRPDGWFDLYAGRKKLNANRDRLGTLKAVAEMNEEDRSDNTPDVTAGTSASEDVQAMAEAMGQHAGPYVIEVSPNADPAAVERVMQYATPLDRRVADLIAERAEDAERLKAVHPKARDMVDRATTLLPGEEKSLPDFAPDDSTAEEKAKPLPMPCAEQRIKPGEQKGGPTWEFDTPLGVFEVLTGPIVLAKSPGSGYSTIESAFARVPRGTARMLRKALRAAGRPDLAAVSRVSKSSGAG